MLRSTLTPQLDSEQKAMQRAWLAETRDAYRQRMAVQKQQTADELVSERSRVQKEAEEEKSYKKYVKEANQRQNDIIKQVNQGMIEKHAILKDKYMREKQNPWGDNSFFEKMWMEKGVM